MPCSFCVRTCVAEFPLVTVTIPTYERPNFLAKAIELVHKQGVVAFLVCQFLRAMLISSLLSG